MNLSISCKISSGDYAKIVFAQFLSEYWVFFLFPLLIGGCLSVFDVRFLIVVLMMVFLAVPFVVMWLYFYYMLTDSMIWSVSDKVIALADDRSMVLDFDNPKLQPVMIKSEAIKRSLTYKRYTLLQVEPNRFRFLVIPDSAFSSDIEKGEFKAHMLSH